MPAFGSAIAIIALTVVAIAVLYNFRSANPATSFSPAHGSTLNTLPFETTKGFQSSSLALPEDPTFLQPDPLDGISPTVKSAPGENLDKAHTAPETTFQGVPNNSAENKKGKDRDSPPISKKKGSTR